MLSVKCHNSTARVYIFLSLVMASFYVLTGHLDFSFWEVFKTFAHFYIELFAIFLLICGHYVFWQNTLSLLCCKYLLPVCSLSFFPLCGDFDFFFLNLTFNVMVFIHLFLYCLYFLPYLRISFLPKTHKGINLYCILEFYNFDKTI